MDEYGRNVEAETLYRLEKAIRYAISDKFPDINTITIKYTQPDEWGGCLRKTAEVSSLKELADFISELANSNEKTTNIKLSGRVLS